MNRPIVYDKGKYHDESVQEHGLPDTQASIHTSFFFGWLIDNDLYSEEVAQESQSDIQAYKERKISAIEVYENWDRCLVDDMLSDTGNAFAQYYFDFQKGAYLADYQKLLVKDLPSEFHVEYTWENQAIMNRCIEQRFMEWLTKTENNQSANPDNQDGWFARLLSWRKRPSTK